MRENPHPPVSREISKELLLGKPNVSDDEIERKVDRVLGEYFMNESLEVKAVTFCFIGPVSIQFNFLLTGCGIRYEGMATPYFCSEVY